MKKRILFILTCLVVAAFCSVSAFAAGGASAPVVVQVSSRLEVGHPKAPVTEEAAPDADGELSFQNLEKRMMANYKGLQALQENIAAIEVIDYDKMSDDMRKRLNDIVDLQWLNIKYGTGDAYTTQSLQQAYDSLKAAYDDLKDGTTKKNSDDQIKYLKNMQNQIIMSGESLYIAIQDLNRTDEQLQRQLESMERTVTEMELRHELGQISSIVLEQTKAGQSALVSGKETLEMNLKTCNMQMQMMLGVEMNGELTLHELPKVTDEQLDSMDMEKDMITAKSNSYALLDAANTLDAAEEKYEDAKDEYKSNSYEMKSAQHVWKGAQLQYEATVEKFEGNFRTLFLQVKDYRQVLDAAKVSYELQKNLFGVEQLKYDQGNLAYNKLLDAQDELLKAEDSIVSAEVNLFAAYNNYRWAVDHGLLN